MGIQRIISLFILALSLSFFSACGNDGPAGNGQVTIVLTNNGDEHLPLIDGQKLHFTNLMIPPNSTNLNFTISIDDGGISSPNGFNYIGAELTLRIVQGIHSEDVNLVVSPNLGVASTAGLFPNFNSQSAASFQLLYNEIELVHGEIHY